MIKGTFLKPNKSGASPERCTIDVELCNTSYLYSIGESHIVIHYMLPTGKKGLIEIPVSCMEEFQEKLDKLMGRDTVKQEPEDKELTFFEKVQLSMKG